MYDCKRDLPFCTKEGTGDGDFSDCGFPAGATTYYVTFVILCTYIFTNLFVAAILDNITFGLLRESALVTPNHLELFQQAWSRLDPNARGFLRLHRLREFLENLGKPLAP